MSRAYKKKKPNLPPLRELDLVADALQRSPNAGQLDTTAMARHMLGDTSQPTSEPNHCTMFEITGDKKDMRNVPGMHSSSANGNVPWPRDKPYMVVSMIEFALYDDNVCKCPYASSVDRVQVDRDQDIISFFFKDDKLMHIPYTNNVKTIKIVKVKVEVSEYENLRTRIRNHQIKLEQLGAQIGEEFSSEPPPERCRFVFHAPPYTIFQDNDASFSMYPHREAESTIHIDALTDELRERFDRFDVHDQMPGFQLRRSAAGVLQASARMKMSRNWYCKMQELAFAALDQTLCELWADLESKTVKIQALARGYLTRKRLVDDWMQSMAANSAARTLQAMARRVHGDKIVRKRVKMNTLAYCDLKAYTVRAKRFLRTWHMYTLKMQAFYRKEQRAMDMAALLILEDELEEAQVDHKKAQVKAKRQRRRERRRGVPSPQAAAASAAPAAALAPSDDELDGECRLCAEPATVESQCCARPVLCVACKAEWEAHWAAKGLARGFVQCLALPCQAFGRLDEMFEGWVLV